MQKINAVKSLITGKNPDVLYNEMIRNNPQFKKFVDDNKDKTIEDIAMAYDIDLDMIIKFM